MRILGSPEFGGCAVLPVVLCPLSLTLRARCHHGAVKVSARALRFIGIRKGRAGKESAGDQCACELHEVFPW